VVSVLTFVKVRREAIWKIYKMVSVLTFKKVRTESIMHGMNMIIVDTAMLRNVENCRLNDAASHTG